MPKAVMLSIQPKWCEKIASGEKTVEIRKTKPKLETPFKCYIYMTSGDASIPDGRGMIHHHSGGKCVIGEFVCDDIQSFGVPYPAFSARMNKDIMLHSCLTYTELHRYAMGNCLYAWHISKLVIYEAPKPLRAFFKECDGLDNTGMCWECEQAVGEECDCAVNGRLYLARPPQSWCYVEEAVANG